MKYYFVKQRNSLIPIDVCKPFEKLEEGEEIEIEITNKRNVKFIRKFFALINLAYENQEHYNNLDNLRKDITISAGFYEERINYITGEVILEAKSISFSKMEEQEFEKVYNAVLDAIIKFIGVEKEDILNELLQF